MLALTHTHADLAERYGTTPRVIASWLDDIRSGRGLVASAYAPTPAETLDEARRALDEIVARLRDQCRHETGDKLVRAGDFLLRAIAALELAAPEPVHDEPDLDRELADLLRVTQSPLTLEALRN
jgi:hypothetical protein